MTRRSVGNGPREAHEGGQRQSSRTSSWFEVELWCTAVWSAGFDKWQRQLGTGNVDATLAWGTGFTCNLLLSWKGREGAVSFVFPLFPFSAFAFSQLEFPRPFACVGSLLSLGGSLIESPLPRPSRLLGARYFRRTTQRAAGTGGFRFYASPLSAGRARDWQTRPHGYDMYLWPPHAKDTTIAYGYSTLDYVDYRM